MEDAKRVPQGSTLDEHILKLEELRNDFLVELANMPKGKVEAIAFHVLCEEDLARPFNSFGTEANYHHFGRCVFLEAYEAVPLSMGKDPRYVTWTMVKPHLGASLFANEFANRLDRLDRAIRWGELPERFTPLQFLTWAHEYKMPVPDAFVQYTFIRGEPVHYWHDLCEVLNDRLLATRSELEQERGLTAALNADNEAQAQTFDDWLTARVEINRLRAEHETEVATLKTELAEARNVASAPQPQVQEGAKDQDDALSTSERKSLLIIAVAAATDGYGYSPTDSKSPVPKQITDAAHLIGLPMTDDTVRKWLKEAVKLKGFTRIHKAATKPNSGSRKPKSV